MNLGGWRFLLFGIAGLGAIVLIATIGAPDAGEEHSVDRYTGTRVRVVKTVADAIAEARDTGNARAALEAIRRRRQQFPEDDILARTEAVFLAELAPWDAPPPEAHPRAGAAEAERRRAAAARDEIRRRARERLSHESLLALLANLEADEAVAAETEDFFAPLARWAPEHEPGAHRPEELAARALAEDAAPEAYVGMARAYQSEGRPRARLRWLLRAYARLPDSAEARDELLGAYLEEQRLVEAFLAVGSAVDRFPEDLALWARRAEIAGWLSLPTEEAEAQEALLRAGASEATRERLITLYAYSGRPEDAIPHAEALAQGSRDPAVLERPAKLALQAGDVDAALAILERRALASDDPAFWRERKAEILWQDLRVDALVEELEILRGLHPERDYEKRIEEVLRRCDRRRRLLALLEERLLREPENRALEEEVRALHAGLGNAKAAHEILARQVARITDPRRFFEGLPTYHGLGMEGLPDLAARMAASPELREEDVPRVLARLQALGDGFRDAARAAARRHPHLPESREFLIHDADGAATDLERARAAEALAREHDGDPAYLAAWIERASWAGDLESEIRAREAWLRRRPEDEENRRELADRYSGAERPKEAAGLWRVLAERDGIGSEAALRLLDALFAAGELEEAVSLLERRATLPGTTVEDKLAVAEQLFGSSRFDRALRFYMAVLDVEPENAAALLRVGQIRSWTNDPRGAIPFLERRLEASEEAAAEVRYYLGEAHWSVHEDSLGHRYHERALAELLPKDPRSLDQDIMVAKMLARFGRTAEAVPVFERVLAAAPGAVDLLLDYADSMASIGNAPKARELVDRASAIEPLRARTMRLDGKVALLERRYEAAAVILGAALERHGPDAATESELGRALELAGDWTPARDAYRRSLTLQPDNRDLEEALQRMADRVSHFVHGTADYEEAGDDSVLRAFASGSLLLGDRWRVAGRLGVGEWSGRADAVDLGQTDVEETALLLGASAFWRYRREHVVAGGVEAYPGAPGDAPLGGWLGALWTDPEPYRALRLRGHAHMLLEEPAACVGLAGRTSGVEIGGHHDFLGRFWGSFEARYAWLSLDEVPNTAPVRDGFLAGDLTLGWRLHDGQNDVADRVETDRATLPLLEGPDVDGDPRRSRGPLVALWASYRPMRLLDDRSLAKLVPIGERFDYVSLGARADFHLAPSLGASVEGTAGYDFAAGDDFFQLDAAMTWRPGHATELTLAGGYGRALGRSDGAENLRLRLAFTLRW